MGRHIPILLLSASNTQLSYTIGPMRVSNVASSFLSFGKVILGRKGIPRKHQRDGRPKGTENYC